MASSNSPPSPPRSFVARPVTTDELNVLVSRYLRHSGFSNAAFAFDYESGIKKFHFEDNLVPPGSLLAAVQKGIQYIECQMEFAETRRILEEQRNDLVARVESVEQKCELLQAQFNEMVARFGPTQRSPKEPPSGDAELLQIGQGPRAPNDSEVPPPQEVLPSADHAIPPEQRRRRRGKSTHVGPSGNVCYIKRCFCE